MTSDPYSPVEPQRNIAVGPIVWGTILIVVGFGWLLAALGVATLPWRAALAAVLIVVGLALFVATAMGPAPEGLFTAGSVLAVILALLSTAGSALSLPLAGGIGERDLAPTIATLEPEYRLVAGELDIDLSDVAFPEGDTHMEVAVTFGTVTLRNIPDDVAVSVRGRVTAGQVALLGSRWDGVSIDHTREEIEFGTTSRRLILDVRVGFGQVEVRR